MFNRIAEFLKDFLGYTVYSVQYGKWHYTWTLQEAIDWVKCYPADDYVSIFHFGEVIATRKP